MWPVKEEPQEWSAYPHWQSSCPELHLTDLNLWPLMDSNSALPCPDSHGSAFWCFVFCDFGHLIEMDSRRTCLLCLTDVTRHNDLKVHYYVVLLCSSYVVAYGKHSFLSEAKQWCTACADHFTMLALMRIWITSTSRLWQIILYTCIQYLCFQVFGYVPRSGVAKCLFFECFKDLPSCFSGSCIVFQSQWVTSFLTSLSTF